MHIVYLQNSKQEIKEAAVWYDKQKKGLDKKLMNDVSVLHSKKTVLVVK